MDFVRAMSLILNSATDEELNKAWRVIGEHKQSLRRLFYAGDVAWRKLVPRFRDANSRIDDLWDEMMLRQTCPWYYGQRKPGSNTAPPIWTRHHNFLKREIPSIYVSLT